MTFLLGFIHGVGFAGVLAELSLPPSQFAWTQLQFNVGLELGQLLNVVVFTTVLFSMRRAVSCPLWLVRGGSGSAMVIGALSLLKRTTNVSILPPWPKRCEAPSPNLLARRSPAPGRSDAPRHAPPI